MRLFFEFLIGGSGELRECQAEDGNQSESQTQVESGCSKFHKQPIQEN